MKRVHCIVEGQTEVAVFYSILAPYILDRTGAYIEFTPIKHSGGGIVPYAKLFPELRNHLKDRNKILTTFFDYYGIYEGHNFPQYKEAKLDQTNPKVGVQVLEDGILNDLNGKGFDTRNFIPYIQLHEFEALLFSSDDGFNFQYDDSDLIDTLNRIRNRFETPEDINDSPQTAPSKRIIKTLENYRINYEKVVDGEAIAKEVGLDCMLENCPRFRAWIESLIEKILVE